MAIINSIVIGKGKGKVGNVVLTTLKGQVIAKARNYSPYNPKSDAQVISRTKMSNAVLAWKFLAGFLSMWVGVANATESIYNAFVSAAKNFMSNMISVSPMAAVAYLNDLSLPGNAIFHVSEAAVSAASARVSFNTQGLAKPSDLHVRLFLYDQQQGASTIVDRLVTDAEWLTQSATIVVDTTAYSDYAVFSYSKFEKKSSNILFGSW